jgi:RNA polymerase sigma factor (sigma-70 family)
MGKSWNEVSLGRWKIARARRLYPRLGPCYGVREKAGSETMSDPTLKLVADAAAGGPAAARELVRVLYPVVQARVGRVLWRLRGGGGRDLRGETEDLTQEVFAFLFEDRAKALLAWDPTRGLSLPNFVGLLAERRAISHLRSGRQSHYNEDPTTESVLDHQSEPSPGPEPAAFSRELLAALLDRLREELSPLGMHLFVLIYVEERSVEEVAAAARLSADAVYAWRSRLRKLVAVLAAELAGDSGPIAISPRKEVTRHEPG